MAKLRDLFVRRTIEGIQVGMVTEIINGDSSMSSVIGPFVYFDLKNLKHHSYHSGGVFQLDEDTKILNIDEEKEIKDVG